MKKLIAILLALLLVFTLAACGGKDDASGGASTPSGENAGDVAGGDVGGGDGASANGSKLYGFYEKYLADGGYGITYEMKEYTEPIVCAFDGDKLYIDSTVDGQKSIIIQNDDGLFVLMPDMKMYMKLNSDGGGMEIPVDPFETYDELSAYTTGSMDVDGKSYEYEEYAEGEVPTRYLFDGAELAYIITDVGGENESSMKIVELTKDVDASLFVIPDGYTSF